MPSVGPFRALSIDLWFTAFYHLAEDAAAWERARIRVLRELLARPDGEGLGEGEVARAVRVVGDRLRAAGDAAVTTEPAVVVRAIAELLGAEVTGPPASVVRAYSAAGLRDRPPRPNPEAVELVRSLELRGIPAVLVTNSSRPAATWSEFLRASDGPRFRDVVSSCDLGVAKPGPAIFREAARRLGVPPSQVLHVGDRWELDVAGALAAGCGATLYRGLWARYPDGLYPSTSVPPAKGSGVPVLDHLEPLLDPSLWDAGAHPRREARAATG